MTALNAVPSESEKPSIALVFVTPEMAARWLKRNHNNRVIRRGDVDRQARDMLAGEWQLTGETIKFAPDGTLLDGQHRLSAIVKSGVTVGLYVARGIDPQAQKVMDTGKARTVADSLRIASMPHSSTVAAAAKVALGVESDAQDVGKHQPSHAEIHAWIQDNPGIYHAADFASQISRRCDCPPAVVTYSYWRLKQIDQWEAAQFWTAAADKVGLTAGDPVIALTNRFAEARRNRETLTRNIQLSLIYRAWNARRAGKSLRFLRVNSPVGGLVPIPEPK